MTTPVKKENLRAALGKVMQSHQLKPQEVKKKYSKIEVSGYGEFICDMCPHTWHSNFSWVRFDLIDLEIVYWWKMKCKCCLALCTPYFTEEQLVSMFTKIVVFYKGEDTKPPVNIGYGARRIFRPPHLPELCEKCGWGQERCWTRKCHYS